MFDLGPGSRVVLAVLWIGGQVVLIGTANRRADGAFGFRMFPESSTIEIHLERETDRGPVPVIAGEWTAADDRGQVQRFAWTDRVKDPILKRTDVTVNAAYGANAQLERLQAALDDVTAHIERDHETRALVANVTVIVNGREPHLAILRSAR